MRKAPLDKRTVISLRLADSIRQGLEFYCNNRPYPITLSEAIDRAITFYLAEIDYQNIHALYVPPVKRQELGRKPCSFSLTNRNLVVLTTVAKMLGIPRTHLITAAINNLLAGKYPDFK